jgi:hypothetical protein
MTNPNGSTKSIDYRDRREQESKCAEPLMKGHSGKGTMQLSGSCHYMILSFFKSHIRDWIERRRMFYFVSLYY